MQDIGDILLFRNQIAEAGVPDDWALGYRDFVRFSDVDAFQHVNNAAYLRWFETIRTLYLREMQQSTGVAQPKMALRSATMDYAAPMFMHEAYFVLGRTTHVGRSSFLMEYAVWSEGIYKMTSTAVMITIDDTATRAVPIPAPYRQIMIERDRAAEK